QQGSVSAWDAATGQPAWSINPDLAVQPPSSYVGPSALAVAGDGTIYAVDDFPVSAIGTGGSLDWTVPLHTVSAFPPTLSPLGQLYVTIDPGTLQSDLHVFGAPRQ
ncbi:MAG TPA: hypothetical protein VFH70_04655, partial [Acidimicrobiales bacterium]|nr:hypothetical protein [Acidimicrobiales bacterium]